MSEVQNSVFIVLLTGSFTILGFVINALLEFRKEKWRTIQEKENRRNETEQECKRSYLSPLYFYVNKCTLESISDRIITFSDLKHEFTKFYDISDKIKEIEDLMKSNMHILPMEINSNLNDYVSNLKTLVIYAGDVSTLVGKLDRNSREKVIQKEALDGIAELSQTYNSMTNNILSSIYAFMKFDTVQQMNPYATAVISMEITLKMSKINLSLYSELEKKAD
jgi:hypothetical protein